MNERIRELAYQAEEYADTIVDQGGEFHPAYTQKFAELIIKECASIQMVRSVNRHGYDKYEDAQAIKQHFGVDSNG